MQEQVSCKRKYSAKSMRSFSNSKKAQSSVLSFLSSAKEDFKSLGTKTKTTSEKKRLQEQSDTLQNLVNMCLEEINTRVCLRAELVVQREECESVLNNIKLTHTQHFEDPLKWHAKSKSIHKIEQAESCISKLTQDLNQYSELMHKINSQIQQKEEFIDQKAKEFNIETLANFAAVFVRDLHFDIDEEILRRQVLFVNKAKNNIHCDSRENKVKVAAVSQWKEHVEQVLGKPLLIPQISDKAIILKYRPLLQEKMNKKDSRVVEKEINSYIAALYQKGRLVSENHINCEEAKEEVKDWISLRQVYSTQNTQIERPIGDALLIEENIKQWTKLIKHHSDIIETLLKPHVSHLAVSIKELNKRLITAEKTKGFHNRFHSSGENMKKEHRPKSTLRKHPFFEVVENPFRNELNLYNKYYRFSLDSVSSNDKAFYENIIPLLEGSDLYLKKTRGGMTLCQCKLHKSLLRIDIKRLLKPGLDTSILVEQIGSVQGEDKIIEVQMSQGVKLTLILKDQKAFKEWSDGLKTLLKNKQSLPRLSTRIESYTSV